MYYPCVGHYILAMCVSIDHKLLHFENSEHPSVLIIRGPWHVGLLLLCIENHD